MTNKDKQRRLRKIIIHVINESIKQDIIPFRLKHRRMPEKGYAKINVCGMPTLINWIITEQEQFRMSVWWNFTPEVIPSLKNGVPGNMFRLLPCVGRERFRFVVGCCASFYFDYRQRAILSDRGREFFAVYVRSSCAAFIDNLEDIPPAGYSISELTRSLLL